VVVDAAAAAPYAHIDLDELGADVVAVNAPAWGGPQVGALAFRDPSLLDRIPAVSLNPFARGPERLEVGAHQYAMLAGLTTSVDFLANLDDTATGTRREKLETSISSLMDYQDGLFDHLMASLKRLPHVMVIGKSPSRVPTLSFTVNGVPAEKVTAFLADRRIATVCGGPGSSRLLDALGVNDEGGAVTIGLAPYTTRYEIDQLTKELAELG
ncbi:MAG: aminotransferase class V-fold PLP-dependent enzyme, partial [Rhodococcus sp.]|nr:aminotransferase class V-fold PLP-dependent enzyme [Rhodococcus sp. (in: high G+C Gram-positive bacteria)]